MGVEDARRKGATEDQAIQYTAVATAMKIGTQNTSIEVLLDSMGGDPKKAAQVIDGILKESGIQMTPTELNWFGNVAAKVSALQQNPAFATEIALEMLDGKSPEEAQTAASQKLWENVLDEALASPAFGESSNLNIGADKGNRMTAWEEQIPRRNVGGVDGLPDEGYNNKERQWSETIPTTGNAQNESGPEEITSTSIAEPKKKGNKEVAVSATDEGNSHFTTKWKEDIGSSSWEQSAQEEMLLVEYETIGESEETARLYNANGGLALKKKGDENHVDFTDEEIVSMNGGVLTHNHPNGSCFSPEDIDVLRQGKLAEIRAVTERGIYRLQNVEKWNDSISRLEKIQNAYYNIDNEVSMEFYNRARMGEITFAQAELLGQEATIYEFARRYGLPYKFDSWERTRGKTK